MKVRLRNPTPSDAKRIYEIEVSSFDHPFSFLVILSQVILHGDTSLVAEVNGKVVGYAIAAKEVDKKLHLLNFAVDPQYRGLGIGSALLESLEKLAKKKGLKSIYLEVEEDNYRAMRLYKKMGFVEVGRIRKYYPWGKDAIVMVKEVA
ncbi:ribosomal protein S18-alanine N-acetyltransferase [Ignicoccus hospitalis]|uniref:Ribosomal-protein-alanine acetyltransferase n=1 Tax=Ignicoccus hospitalis (strain KIN4/I / DSM 18386 / JCM 14125) TaxID=453591 RepID=A8AA08_IGNH4|nr:ribosomal protein S18-alanine N-acetyltransferase [Ignicoccus hospitalis]ABU81760.1 ribosomal-protein-alanine acetyltransferase [Ignicoccus hospitalis KIN4/I]HIH90028.1 ribosomal protein S18-alanine N-acetyltransferase [Desulfurococcaceae archaeon]